MLEIHNKALNADAITSKWFAYVKEKNLGACINFVGIVRDEHSIEGLSFDVYEPILNKWFNEWQEKAKQEKALVFMAHSVGDVFVHESSFIASICSINRKVGLRMIGEFVEDFKKNAPIWKYDLVDGKRVFAEARSHKLQGAGLIG